ncbi:MAG: Gldg family protein [Acidobacteria bacterium]|nr:Gldg family protein [Acidobacteriota bacterium]
MEKRWKIPRAILKRELISYFSSPTGYVFITLFVFLSAIAAFWQEWFFAGNLANLDPLNGLMPYLLVFFIPAITMSIWAEERKNGTDELLLTLPATDSDIVIGKYLATLAIFGVALLFSLSHVVVLSWLGSPDWGLMLSTYLGYALMGAALLALGMLASLLTENLTIAFIAGTLLCATPVFIDDADALLSGRARRVVEGLSLLQQFEDFATGVISLSSVLYFVLFAASVLYLNVAILGRRHWPTGKGTVRLGRHYLVRGVALVVGLAGVTILAGRIGGRLDVTAERIHSLSDQTRKLIQGLDPKRPVFIQAHLSSEVPRDYVQTRNNIVAMLREFEGLGKGRIHVHRVTTEKYTPEAREAQEKFNISARPVPVSRQAPGGPTEIYLGVAFNSGSEEFVIPFFDPGLPVEYELMRSVRVVSRASRKKIGVLQTAANVFGGYDFATRNRTPEWSIVAELRKQYDVVQVSPAVDYPDDLDVLMAVQPSTLEPGEVAQLTQYARKGKPILVMVDPLPVFNPMLSPQQMPYNPMTQEPPRQPADVKPLMDAVGVEWLKDKVAWDKYNPHPQFRTLPPEVIFVGAGNKGPMPFNKAELISSGLQEVVMIDPGFLKPIQGRKVQFTPLIQTGKESGSIEWGRVVQDTLFGIDMSSKVPHVPDGNSYVLAARVRAAPGGDPVNAIIIADADMMGEQFFQMRRAGLENLQFDNVTFLLNVVDQLAGDESFIALRKRRPRHRTLEAVEARTKVYEERRVKEMQDAEKTAEQRLKEAQDRLGKSVEQLRKRTDLDEQTKQIMLTSQESVENRRLAVARANIEEEKERFIERSRADMEASIRRIQNTIKILAVALPPVPAFALFLWVSLRRLRREKIGVLADRIVNRREALSG